MTDNKPNFIAKLILLLGANLTLGAGGSLSPAMPAMLDYYSGISGAALWVSLMITLPALFVVIGGPLAGFLSDKFGRKPVLVFSILIGGVAGSAGAILGPIWVILLTRAFVGLSIAGALTATNALIADYFDGQKRAQFMGYQSAIGGLNVVFFLPLGGLLAGINWRLTFLAYLPLLLLFPLAFLFIYEPRVVSKSGEPPIKHKLQLQPSVIYIYTAVFFSQFAFITIPIFIAYYMTDLLGVSPLAVGLASAASGFFSFVAGLFYERIGRKIHFRNLSIIGFVLMGLGFVILGVAESWVLVISGQLIVGFFLGLMFANLTTWLADQVRAVVRGRANGMFVTMMFLGSFITSFVFTPIASATSYHVVFILSGVIIILTGLAALFLKPD